MTNTLTTNVKETVKQANFEEAGADIVRVRPDEESTKALKIIKEVKVPIVADTFSS